MPIAGKAAHTVSLKLIQEFGSLAAVLAAPLSRRNRTLHSEPETARHLEHIRKATLHAMRDEALLGPKIAGTEQLARYLRAEMGWYANEQLRVLFLATELRLIADDVMTHGTVDSATLLPRPIIHRALDLAAAGIILIHNHPGGSPEPSQADIEATYSLAKACWPMEIQLLDHLIVARNGWVSFRVRGLL